MTRRIVDLTQRLTPGENGSPLQAEKYELPDVARTVHHRITLEGATGTHVVAPYRYLGWGSSVGEISPDKFFGEAVALRVPGGAVGATELEDASAGRLRLGDIAVVVPASATQPPSELTLKGAQWLFIKGAKLVALDEGIAPGLAGDAAHMRDVLLALLENEVPVVLNLTNTAKLSDQRLAVMALPSPVKGLDAWPVRVVALDPGAEPVLPTAEVPEIPAVTRTFDDAGAAGDEAALAPALAVAPDIAPEPVTVDATTGATPPDLVDGVPASAATAEPPAVATPSEEASLPTPAPEAPSEAAHGTVAEP